jgi:hypothetical protein
MDAVRERCPRTVFVIIWGSKWPMTSNYRAAALLDDSWAIHRDGAAWASGGGQ